MRRIAALVVILVVGTGCVGVTDRTEFDAEVRSRGGGLSVDWIETGLTAAAEALAAPDIASIEVLTLTITPQNRSLVVQARRGDQPDFVDTVAVLEGSVVNVTPLRDTDELPLDEITIGLDDLPLGDINDLVDRAIAAFDREGTYVVSVEISIVEGEHRVDVLVENDRHSGRVSFDLAGSILEVAE